MTHRVRAVGVDGTRQRVDMPNGMATIEVGEASVVVIDPGNRILREGNE